MDAGEAEIAWLDSMDRELKAERERAEAAKAQIKQLAVFIMENIPGEPSQSESAVNCAIRLLAQGTAAEGRIAELEAENRRLRDEVADL